MPRVAGHVTLRNIEQQHSFIQTVFLEVHSRSLPHSLSDSLARHCLSILKNHPRAEDGGDGGEELPLCAALRRPHGDGAVAAIGVAEARGGRPRRPAADLVVLVLLLLVAAPRYL